MKNQNCFCFLCVAFFFFLEFIGRPHCVPLLWCHRTYIQISRLPRTVGSETQARFRVYCSEEYRTVSYRSVLYCLVETQLLWPFKYSKKKYLKAQTTAQHWSHETNLILLSLSPVSGCILRNKWIIYAQIIIIIHSCLLLLNKPTCISFSDPSHLCWLNRETDCTHNLPSHDMLLPENKMQ